MTIEFDYTLRTVTIGTALLGAVTGALGAFAVLRRQSLLGDAVAHAALPGIALAFALTGSKSPAILLIGAAAAGGLAAWAVTAIARHTRVPYDSALGVVLATFFGLGLVLLRVVQQISGEKQTGLERYLFGQAATTLRDDFTLIVIIGVLAAVVLIALWNPMRMLAFDPEYAAVVGLPVRLLDGLLTGMLVFAVVAGLPMVGVVLVSALVVAPAAAARQWTDRLATMVVASAAFGAIAGAGGTVLAHALSSPGRAVPTGPVVVLVAVAIVIVSLIGRNVKAMRNRYLHPATSQLFARMQP